MKILHVFRTPVGGLFRHVRDLARGQSELGHEVGIICDSTTGGGTAVDLLQSVVPYCSLGIERIQISRLPGLGDLSAASTIKAHAKKLGVDIIHGHGAKGGLYGRLAARSLQIPSVYTPHGGSLHYRWLALPGALFLASEWTLARIGSGLIFVTCVPCHLHLHRHGQPLLARAKRASAVRERLGQHRLDGARARRRTWRGGTPRAPAGRRAARRRSRRRCAPRRAWAVAPRAEMASSKSWATSGSIVKSVAR